MLGFGTTHVRLSVFFLQQIVWSFLGHHLTFHTQMSIVRASLATSMRKFFITSMRTSLGTLMIDDQNGSKYIVLVPEEMEKLARTKEIIAARGENLSDNAGAQ